MWHAGQILLVILPHFFSCVKQVARPVFKNLHKIRMWGESGFENVCMGPSNLLD